MTRNTFRSIAIAYTMAVLMLAIAARQQAFAQQDPNCCDYIVNSSHIPAACFPLAITTSWAGGLSATVVVSTPAFNSFHVPFACPPAPAFQSVTVTSAGIVCCIRPVSFFCGGCLFIELVPC